MRSLHISQYKLIPFFLTLIPFDGAFTCLLHVKVYRSAERLIYLLIIICLLVTRGARVSKRN